MGMTNIFICMISKKNFDRLRRYFFRFSPSIFFRGGSAPPLLKMNFEYLTA